MREQNGGRSDAAFVFENVRFKEILDIPGLSISRQKITTLIGQSGSGKTTILRLLCKMLSPTQGCIYYEEQCLTTVNSVLHRRRVTMLSQTPAMFAGTVRDNLVAGLSFQKRELPGEDVLRGMLEKVKLDKNLDDGVSGLSGGERQRLALGRVLLLDAPVYLLDEPSSALDESTARAVVEMIARYAREEGKTLVMVTHSSAIARAYSDRVIEIARGSANEGNL